jgi:hypothetical protein
MTDHTTNSPAAATLSSRGPGAAVSPVTAAAADQLTPPAGRGRPVPPSSPGGTGRQSSPQALSEAGASGARAVPGGVRLTAGSQPARNVPGDAAARNAASPGTPRTRVHPAAAAMSEDELERHVRAILEDLSGYVLGYHTYFSKASHAGFPDWVFAGIGGVLFRELKTARGRLSVTQVMWRRTLREAGADVDVWRPEDLLSGRIARELAAIAGIGGAA